MYILFLSAGLIATIGDFVVPALLGKKHPNYNHYHHTISELGVQDSPVRKWLSLWLIILGMLLILFGIGQFVQFTGNTLFHRLYVFGIIAFGVGAGIIAGIFSEDSPAAEETKSGKVHGIFAGLGFIFLLLNPLWAQWIHELGPYRTVNLLFFVIALVFFALFVSSKEKTGILGMSGLWQRLYLLAIYSVMLINFIVSKSA